MPNPIKTSDIYQDTGELKALIAELQQVEKVLTDLKKAEVKNAQALRKSTDQLIVTQSDHRDQIKETSKQAEEINRRYKKYTQSLDDNAVKLAALKNAQQDINRVNKLTAKLNAAQEGSYNRLSAQYSLLKIRLNQMSKAQREGTVAGKQMVKQSAEIYEEMKRLQEVTGKHTLNVGNYKSALEGLQGVAGTAVDQASDLWDQFKTLIRNPIAGVISAGAAALGVMFKAFTQSERGARLMTKIQTRLNGLWGEAVKYVSDLANEAATMWDDPKKALSDYTQSFNKSFAIRVQGVFDLLIASGERFGAVLSGNAELAEDAANRITAAMQDISDGQDETERAASQAEREESRRRQAAIDALDDRRYAVAQLNRELQKQAEIAETNEQVAQQVSSDTTLSLKAQLSAVDALVAAGLERRKLESEIANNNLSIAQEQIRIYKEQGRDIQALLDQEISLIQTASAAERELLVFRQDVAQQRREISRDIYERELDFAIDLYDSQKTILERQANDKTKELSDRTEALVRLIELDKSAFAEQIRLTEEFTGQRVKLNELALLDDEKIVRERLRQLEIDDVATGRILEILRDRKAATQDILEVERDLTALRQGAVSPIASGAERELDEQKRIRDLTVGLIANRNQDKGDRSSGSLLDLLGINIGDDEKQALKDSVSYAISQIQQLAQAKVDAAERAVQAEQREVDQAQAKLDSTIELAQLGYAVNVSAAQAELELAQQREDEALEIKRKAEKEQRQLDSLSQASSLFTASAKILASVPFPANLIAVGTMLGSFAYSKIRAKKLTKEFRDGDYTVLGGKSHELGGTFLRTDEQGVDEYAERGEGRAIFSRKAVRKYGRQLPDLVDSINSLTFERRFSSVAGMPTIVGSSVDTSRMEGHLSAIRENGTRQTYNDSKGRRIERYKNQTIVYN